MNDFVVRLEKMWLVNIEYWVVDRVDKIYEMAFDISSKGYMVL